MRTFTKADYELYLLSATWKALRYECLRKAGFRCVLCNSKNQLAAHHRTYDRVGREHEDDLTCLCTRCHHFLMGAPWIPGKKKQAPSHLKFKQRYKSELRGSVPNSKLRVNNIPYTV